MGVIYEIKRGSTLLASVEGKGERQEAIMGVDVVNMSFTLNTYVNFLKGDTCMIAGQLFVLKAPSEFDRGGKWDYSLQFLSDPYTLGDIQVLAADEDNNLTEYDCPFTGTASEVMDLILLNANRLSSGWSKGVVDATETLDFDFTGDSCSTALAKLADTCKTEFWVVGKTIHLTKRGADSGLSFRHGKGLGLTKLIRKNTNSKLVTRLHVYGSTRNLPASYPGLSKRLRMPAGQLYIEDPAKVALYGRSEDTHVFEDIYPKRIGTVTAATDAFTFTDTSLNFDINAQLIPGTSAKVKFVSGQLAGWEFDIRDNGYNHGTKAITINANKDEKAISVPSDTGLKPAVGDQYVLFDIIMPQAFIDDAEAELLAKGQELYNSICDPQAQFEAPTDRRYLRDNGITINLGDYVNIADTEAGIDNDIRVTSKITNLQDPNDVKLELSNTTAVSNIVRQLINEKVIQRVIKINNLTDINRSRRNRKTSDETIAMMFDPATGQVRNDKLDVGYIAAQAARFGTGSQDFQLSGIIFQPGATSLGWSGGKLLHNVITDQGGIWTLSSGSASGLLAGTAYYVYAKVSKSAATGVIMVTTGKMAFDSGDGYYYLWIGVLNSVIDGARMLSTTYGVSEINGRLLRTGEVANTAGDPVMDIDNRTFYGTFKFSDGRDAKVAVDATKEVTDNFTVIDGGVTMANTMKVGTAGVDVAGMTAVGSDDSAIWLWGGTTFADRANASFRVNRAGKVWLTDAEVTGKITATSGSIAGVSISADDQFSLTGSKVKITPDKGVNVYGYFSGPKAAPAVADMEVGEYYEYILENGSGAPGSSGFGLFDLQGVQQVGALVDGQVLRFNGASAKFENWTPNYVAKTTTITINGVSYDLSENRSWTVSGGGGSGDYLPLAGGVLTGPLSIGTSNLTKHDLTIAKVGVSTIGLYNTGARAVGDLGKISFGVDGALNASAVITARNIGGANAKSQFAFNLYDGTTSADRMIITPTGVTIDSGSSNISLTLKNSSSSLASEMHWFSGPYQGSTYFQGDNSEFRFWAKNSSGIYVPANIEIYNGSSYNTVWHEGNFNPGSYATLSGAAFTGGVSFGARNGAKDSVVANRISILPPSHAGTWHIGVKDDASVAHMGFYYNEVEVFRINHRGHFYPSVATTAPIGAPATADMEVGKYYEYIRAI